jgi:HEAT repeat protein
MPDTSKTLATTTVSIKILILIVLSAASCCALTPTNSGWTILEAGVGEKNTGKRLAAIRVLGLITDDPHAADLAEKALKDKDSAVRAAAATALGLMHASGADVSLKLALNDKNLSVVMAAAHALHLLNDPACYEVYYAVYTGERKNNTGMVAQEMQILHDPKQLAMMGFDEGIGYVPFAGIPWEAFQTIMKDRKSGTAAKAALIASLAPDPDAHTGRLLVNVSHNKNWVLRVAALDAIAKRGDPALLPSIEDLLSDSKREVRYTAAATVVRLNDIAEAKAAAATKVVQTVLPATPKEANATQPASTRAVAEIH